MVARGRSSADAGHLSHDGHISVGVDGHSVVIATLNVRLAGEPTLQTDVARVHAFAATTDNMVSSPLATRL
jgi:hypothetical protein